MAIAKAKLDRCQELAIEDYSRCVWRAFDFWDDDQKARALEIAKNLEKQPERTVHALRQSKKGAELMITYWAGLADAARTNGGWDEAQKRLAFDLLAVRVELRSGSTQLPLGGGKEALVALAEQQIAKLEDRIERVLERCHTAEQDEAVAGIFYVEDAATKKLRKDESRARCDYNKAYGMLLAGRAEAEAGAGDKGDGIPPMPPKASEAGFDYLLKRFQTMCRMPVGHNDSCDLGEVGEDESEGSAATPEEPVAAADWDAVSESDSHEADADAASAAETETQTQAESETETPAAATHRPMTKRARKLREKRLREAAKREARRAKMAH